MERVYRNKKRSFLVLAGSVIEKTEKLLRELKEGKLMN